MTQRERLIELLKVTIYPREGVDPAEAVADYLLDNGVIVPPCKVGDTVYVPWGFDGDTGIDILTVTHIAFDCLHAYTKTDSVSDCYEYLVAYDYGRFSFEDFGKTVFLTREKAERALKEGREG